MANLIQHYDKKKFTIDNKVLHKTMENTEL